MLKKCLSLIICICVMLSCMTFGTIGASAEAVVIAADSFSSTEYTDGSNTTGINYVGTAAGTGWDGLWLSDPTDTAKKITDTTVYISKIGVGSSYTCVDASKPTGYNLEIDKYEPSFLYRKLANPVSLAPAADKQYEISFKISEGITAKANRKGFKMELGSSDFHVGYNWVKDANDENTLVVPYVTIGEKTVKSSTEHTKNSGYAAPYKRMIVSVNISASGDDTIKLKMIDEDEEDADWEVTATADLSSKSIGYIGFGHPVEFAYSKFRIADIEISDTTSDISVENLAAQARAAMPGYQAVPIIDSITDETLRAELIGEYNSYGFAYDQMNNARYEKIYSSGSPNQYYGVSCTTLAGGAGWADDWTKTYSKAATNHYPGAYISENDQSGAGLVEDEKLPALLLVGGGTGSSVTMTRTLKTPIDLSVDGEYYVKVAATWNSYTAKPGDRFEILLDELISFGNEFSGESNVNAATYTPALKLTGDTSYTTNDAVPIPYRNYYDYILKIESSAKGSDTLEAYVCDDGALNSDTAAVFTATFSSDEELSTISLKTTGERICVSSVAVDCFNDSVTGNPFKPEEVREEIASADSDEDVQAIFDTLPECTAAQYLRANGVENITVVDGNFTTLDGRELISTAMITDSLLFDFKLKSNYNTTKNVNVILGIYYGNELAGARKINVSVPKKTTTEMYTVGFEDGLPEGDKSNITAKVFIWENNTLTPFTEEINMYSQSDRTVVPEIFGADTAEPVTVAFMGDSITHLNPSYTKWIEYYYRIKYPDKDIKFVSKGISGDTCYGIENRFTWDILNGIGTGKPTEACLMIGMNDVGRSLYPDSGTEAEKQKKIDDCLANIEDVAELCEANGIKLTLITPTLHDEADYTGATADNKLGVNAALGKIAEGVIKFANEKGLAYIDFYGYINSFNTKLRGTDEFKNAVIFNVTDRVHATKQGTFAEGFIFLIQQINDSVIASVEIDADTLTSVTDSAEVTGIEYADGTLSYTYAPMSLPMGVTAEYETNEDDYGIPVTDSINREIIKVTGLEPGDYTVMFGETELGTYTADELAAGVNIATLETNPGQVQSLEVYDLVSAKMALDYKLRDLAFVERWVYAAGVDLTDVDACVEYVNETVKADTTKYSSNKTRIDNYESYKETQTDMVSDIADYEAQAKLKATPGTYSVKIVKQ